MFEYNDLEHYAFKIEDLHSSRNFFGKCLITYFFINVYVLVNGMNYAYKIKNWKVKVLC